MYKFGLGFSPLKERLQVISKQGINFHELVA